MGKNKKEEVLLKDNILVKTKYDLNAIENKLFTLILFNLQKNGDLLKCKMTHSQMKEIIKNKNQNTIRGISEILDKLSSKKIHIQEVKKNKKNSIWHKYNLINGHSYDDEFNTFEIEASEKIYSLVCKKFHDGGYTPVSLAVFLSLKNPYAQRIYELLRLWSGTKTKINYSFEELKMYFMLEKSYPEYGNFKRRVITPAIKELNNTGYFDIEISENKIGKKVESIDFIVKDLDKRVYFDKKEDDKIIELDSTEYTAITSESNTKKKSKVDEFYVPNKKLFTAKTLSDFKNNFSEYDFSDTEYKKLLQESILIALEKDDEEKIKVKSYNYFKSILNNKLDDLISSKNKVSHKKTKFHNFDESFNQYSEDELDDIIEKSQREKYEKCL